MKGIKRVATIVILILVVSLIGQGDVSAEDNGMPFTVEPVLTENQDKNVQSYISEKVKGNDYKQEYRFNVTNSSKEEQDIAVTVVDAYTSPNGVIQYVEEESDNSKITDKEYKMTEYLTADEDIITLQAGESKVVGFKLDAGDVEGTLLGGVSFITLEDGEEIEEEGSSFQINNEINMVVGVMIEFDTSDKVDFEIKAPYVDPMPSYYAVRLPIELKSPLLVKDTELTYDVSFKGEDLFGGIEKISFAPKTETNFSLPFDYEEIEENEVYVIKGTLKYKDRDDNEQTLDFEEEFEYVKNDTVTNKVTERLKAPVVGTGIALYWYLLGVLGVILGVYLYKRRKDKEETEIEIEIETED